MLAGAVSDSFVSLREALGPCDGLNEGPRDKLVWGEAGDEGATVAGTRERLVLGEWGGDTEERNGAELTLGVWPLDVQWEASKGESI